MPQRISSFDTSPMTGFFFTMGSIASYMGVSGYQLLGAIVGSVFIVTTMHSASPLAKALHFFGSFCVGILGAHFVAEFIVGLPFIPATVTQESVIGVGAAISAACGIIVLRRLHLAAKNKSMADVKNLGGKHD